jgi:hypothetical protein
MPARPHCSTMPATVGAGVTMTARSTRLRQASIARKQATPRTFAYFGFTAKSAPLESRRDQLPKTSVPTFPGVSEAPTTATERGSKSGVR